MFHIELGYWKILDLRFSALTKAAASCALIFVIAGAILLLLRLARLVSK